MSTVQVDIHCLHELFEYQVDQCPSQVALIYQDRQYTYAELNALANRLARYLRSRGVKAGDLVGLYLQRSDQPIATILAVLKLGAGYVPIDPSYPVERARYIVDHAKIATVVTEAALVTQAADFFTGSPITLDRDGDAIDRQSSARLAEDEGQAGPHDLCYVLFTSGTTGQPKGIMTEHHSVVKFALSFNESCQITPADRIYQGFSLGFDGSVEELWMAFSNGATLVVGPPEAARDGDAVRRIFETHQITVFSTVPTFLSMVPGNLPNVRLIIVSGEACPPELVRRWAAPFRRLLNVYGPTETTVNATVAECVPDQPVTIGKPLRGYETYVLDEALQPVPPGQPGELYIGGPGLARGYLNAPELTAKAFVPHPFAPPEDPQRIYRTGDLVQWDDDGNLRFLGRIDGQVKIRGYRIELSEIESVLREDGQIYQAVVHVHETEGLKELAAYVVLHDPAVSFDRDCVLQRLRDRLPPYMVPSYLDVLPELPTLASGKVDRKRLPTPATSLVSSRRTIVAPRNEQDEQIVAVWEKLLQVSPLSIEEDFFLDLGGYSLLAAQAVTELRERFGMEIALADIYTHPTVTRLSDRLAQRLATDQESAADSVHRSEHDVSVTTRARTSSQVCAEMGWLRRWSCVALQGLTLLLGYGLASQVALGVVLLAIPAWTGLIPAPLFLLVLSVAIFVSHPLLIASTILVKWILIGRFRAGEYPVWGFYYYRWWVVSRLQELAGVGRFSGTPVMSWYYRLMGAQVGPACVIDTPNCVAYDLVSLGEETSIGSQSQLLGYRVEDGLLKIGRIEIGSRCFVGSQCCLGLNTRMENDSYLDDLSLLPDGAVMRTGESRQGAPAQPASVVLPPIDAGRTRRRHPIFFGILHFIAGELVGELILLALLPLAAFVVLAHHWGGPTAALAALFLGIPPSVVVFCLVTACLKWLVLPRARPGVYSVESLWYVRKKGVDTLLETASYFVYPLYTTIYLRPWLRLLGARIGSMAELAVCQLTPDLTEIGEGSFVADGAMVGGSRYFRNQVQVATSHVGDRSFVGNASILPVGAAMGSNCLLGVTSLTPGGAHAVTPDDTEWLGSPAFQLPYRRKVEGFEHAQLFQPTLGLYIQRMMIDAVRIVLPMFLVVMGSLVFVASVVAAVSFLPLPYVFAVAPLAGIGVVAGLILSVCLVKWLLMGRYHPVIKPLWCPYVWFNEVVNGVYETIGATLTEPAMGSPYFNLFLRWMGCKVGRWAFIESSLFSEFDLVEIGDYAALNRECIVQNHLFEDRIMKSSYCRIGRNSSIGNMSVVLYDTEVKPGAWIGPLSLLMKGETVPPDSRSLGIPTRTLTANGAGKGSP